MFNSGYSACRSFGTDCKREIDVGETKHGTKNSFKHVLDFVSRTIILTQKVSTKKKKKIIKKKKRKDKLMVNYQVPQSMIFEVPLGRALTNEITTLVASTQKKFSVR